MKIEKNVKMFLGNCGCVSEMFWHSDGKNKKQFDII